MSLERHVGDGICILSFDNGGPGSYSQLLILQEYMSRLATDISVSEDEVYPADYFDLMGGVGFGGLVALLLGHLRMNVNQAVDKLLDVASAVFPGGSQQRRDIDTKTMDLKEAIEHILEARNIPLDTKMNDSNRPPAKCKVALYAATSARTNHPQAFRTYPSRGSSLNPTIVDAICATMSIPSHFLPVKIGPRMRQQSFIGAVLGANNPARELLKEASIVFGKDRRVAQIMSIGSGLPRVLSLNLSTREPGFALLITELAVDCETVAQELHTRLYNIPAYLRLNVDRGLEDVVMEDWSELGDIESHTGAYIAVASVSESLDTSLRSLSGRVGTVTLGQLNQSSSIKLLAKSVPAVSPHFITRRKPWTLMVHQLAVSPYSRQKIFPVTGMGGCGKTQMVSYFLQEYPSLYTKVLFVDASSSASIQSDLQTWVQASGNGHERDVWEDAIRILGNIPPNERWLLILDNADNPTLTLAHFMPKNLNLTIIITSRNRDLGHLSTTCHLELGEMEEQEALATLQQSARRGSPLSPEEMESARKLMKELGYLALALVQAGAYCHQLSSTHHGLSGAFTFTQYLSLFYSHRAELMKESQPSPLDCYERGVYTTLDLSYQALSQVHRQFLHFISFFHHSDIPVAALATAAMKNFTQQNTDLPLPEGQKQVISDLGELLCADGKWSELQVQRIIRTLQAFSLLSTTSMDNSIFLQLHPLIQAWSRDMGCFSAASIPSRSYPRTFGLHKLDLHVNERVAIARILRDHGYYQSAARLLKDALEVMENCVEQEKEGTLKITAELASVYSCEGKWSEAEKLDVDILEHRRRTLGSEHLGTILAAENLALTYWYQERYSEAEKLCLEVLEKRREVLGMEHPDTISAAAILAATYWGQGRSNEAEKLDLEVLQQRTKILGIEHPDTIFASASLAATYAEQRRYNEAEKLQSEVLQQRTKILGVEHPDTLLAAGNLASTYSWQGRYNEAEELQVVLLEQRRKIQGMEHPDTIITARNLASTYSEQKRYDEAIGILAQVVELSLKVLGQQHPSTQRRIKDLADLYKRVGKREKAEETRKLSTS